MGLFVTVPVCDMGLFVTVRACDMRLFVTVRVCDMGLFVTVRLSHGIVCHSAFVTWDFLSQCVFVTCFCFVLF